MKFTWKSAASITLATAMGMTLAASRLAAMDGYFSNGYGPQCKALAGACTAVMQGTLAPSSNPAAMFWAGSRVDMGISVAPCPEQLGDVMRIRRAHVTASEAGVQPGLSSKSVTHSLPLRKDSH